MITLTPVKYLNISTATCDPGYAGMKLLKGEGITLAVPDYFRDTNIRRDIELGKDMRRAYSNANFQDYYPSDDIRPCLMEVYKTPGFYDPAKDRLVNYGGNHTCIGFNNCLQEWMAANYPDRDPDPRKRRMVVAYLDDQPIYAPSQAEGDCIKSNFAITKNIYSAYSNCNVGDILPGWPGGPEMVADFLSLYPAYSMYHHVKMAAQFESLKYSEPQTPTISPVISQSISPVETYPYTTIPATSILPDTKKPDETKKTSYLPYIIIPLGLLLFLKKF